MRILVKYKNGTSDVLNVEKIKYFSKNPCLKCRPDGGCYGHGCFSDEDWGDFLDIGNEEGIRIQDVKLIQILSL